MAGNSFGNLFRVTTFGESHGEMIGVVVDGCPAGLEIDVAFIQHQLDRRKPGQSAITTARNESDCVRFVSGVFEGKTTGAPICGLVPNQDQRVGDYDHLRDVYRPSHADYTYQMKYGHRDYRGGGRSSARETVARVVAGAIAQLFLRRKGIDVFACVSQVGPIVWQGARTSRMTPAERAFVESTPVRCPDAIVAEQMLQVIHQVREVGDTVGGVVSAWIQGCSVGLGEPVFDRLQADLGKAMLSINAVKGFEYGAGFESAALRGSEHNDLFSPSNTQSGGVVLQSNRSGGIQGGISNGEEIFFRVAFKPVSTLMQSQKSVTQQGAAVVVEGRGRHDPCVVPRAVPIVEAMAALVIADHWLRWSSTKID